MPGNREQIIDVFKQFVEAGLIEHNAQKALSFIADDVIGIGMGAQGVVTCKKDAEIILSDGKSDSAGGSTEIEYSSIQVRCYEGLFGTVCGVLKIRTVSGGKTVQSTLGQMMALRRQNGAWLISALQATPLFDQFEEMEAYPIKFAENVLEKYRQQEQIAKNVQDDSVAVYLIDYTNGVFEDAVFKNDFVIRTKKGDRYQNVIIESTREHLNEEERHLFIRTFSQDNVLNAYQSGLTELTLEYEMLLPDARSTWMKTVVKLYTDKVTQNLMGYLYVIDIDQEKKRQLELQSKAELDPLTGLYNKTFSELKIAERLKTVSPSCPAAFFMIDLDYFKRINDTYGHHEGDRIIRETAGCLQALTRKSDIAGRVGGDEFCLYIQGEITPAIAMEKAARLCGEIRGLMPSAENGASCSIGIALCTCHKTTFEEVYRKADEALYHQKKNGRNGYTLDTVANE